MITKIDLSGRWGFCLDKEKSGLEMNFHNTQFHDSIHLPTTVSEARKGVPNNDENTYFLTDPYQFEGYTWYSREIEFDDIRGKELFFVLERTRISHVWVDDLYVGTNNSLCTSHRYLITPFINKSKHRLTIMVDNTSYPVKGGHMTSQDTQTNWNGITGRIYIEIRGAVYLEGVKLYPDAEKRQVKVKAALKGAEGCTAYVSVTDNNEFTFAQVVQKISAGENEFTYQLDKTAQLWSEHSPKLYTLKIEIPVTEQVKDLYSFPFGLRAFKAAGKYFEINGSRTFLRGKHDGLIFPITGYAPTDMKSWMDVFMTAKSYGINHYRFHTCCPPEAAFIAADMFGIYLEPELPFWGTVTEDGDENHNEQAQQYLIKEGLRILDEFGNHPSFVMMSLGNELWGSKDRLNDILGKYKQYDSRHLYTQGSNNFQFVPCILENEDFFCGVRFSKDRLFRGSYAMCDAPQGHIQTMAPDTIHNYDSIIRPVSNSGDAKAAGDITEAERDITEAAGEITDTSNIKATKDITDAGKDILIQYGTGTKTVKAEGFNELIPHVPVVSHEIGQYAMYPDYSEISKYTGVLKPRNLEVFQRRLKDEGMLSQAEKFFEASGRLAAECYKAEVETALRSSELAGFQLLDLQDFTGQGTALVGILNAFMENKGLISQEEWREFCSDTVILAELPKLVYSAGESIRVGIKLAHFNPRPVEYPRIRISISEDGRPSHKLSKSQTPNNRLIISKEMDTSQEYSFGVFHVCDFDAVLPDTSKPRKLIINISIKGTDIKNHYDLWLYPSAGHEELKTNDISKGSLLITDSLTQAMKELENGKNILLFPNNLEDGNSIEGAYCTDFWCYPMFRSISESMNKPVPVGTLGLLINKDHKVFEDFPTEYYTTAQWYDIVTHSRAVKLNGTEIEPMVWMIDNFERNNRLGLLFELRVGNGKLLVCTSDLRELKDSLPAVWLMKSLMKYMQTESFEPVLKLDTEHLKQIFKENR